MFGRLFGKKKTNTVKQRDVRASGDIVGRDKYTSRSTPAYDPFTDPLSPVNPLSPFSPLNPLNQTESESSKHSHDSGWSSNDYSSSSSYDSGSSSSYDSGSSYSSSSD